MAVSDNELGVPHGQPTPTGKGMNRACGRRERLESAAQAGRQVQLEQDTGSDRFTNGFILAHSKELVLLHRFVDFTNHGFRLVPMSQVKEVRNGVYERFFEKVLADSNIHRAATPRVSTADWRSFFSDLIEPEELLGIDKRTGASDSDEDLVVGIVSEALDDSVWILSATALGTWEGDEIEVKYSDILGVEFGTPYLKTLYRYLAPEADTTD